MQQKPGGKQAIFFEGGRYATSRKRAQALLICCLRFKAPTDWAKVSQCQCCSAHG